MADLLIVDDDQDLRENLGELLTEAGFSVSLAENGAKALETLEANSFDLILLDSIMPGVDGMEVLTLAKRRYPKCKIVMMTAFSTVDNAVEVMRKGADDYITKPFKINELIVSVRRCLEEAKFSGCEKLVNMDDVFKCLSNVTRRQILLLLNEHQRMRFMDITRALEIEDHTKVNFHLKMLKETGLLAQDSQKNYFLAEKGKQIISCMATMSEPIR